MIEFPSNYVGCTLHTFFALTYIIFIHWPSILYVNMYLQVQQLQFLGGSDLRDVIRRMINRILTSEMQLRFNRTGANNRLSFSEHLEQLIIGMFLRQMDYRSMSLKWFLYNTLLDRNHPKFYKLDPLVLTHFWLYSYILYIIRQIHHFDNKRRHQMKAQNVILRSPKNHF